MKELPSQHHEIGADHVQITSPQMYIPKRFAGSRLFQSAMRIQDGIKDGIGKINQFLGWGVVNMSNVMPIYEHEIR